MKTFLIEDLKLTELKSPRQIIIELPDCKRIPITRGNPEDPFSIPIIKQVAIVPIEYSSPSGDRYLIAAHPQVAKKLQYQIDETFNLLSRINTLNEDNSTLDNLVQKEAKLKAKYREQLDNIKDMSFWKRFKFAITGTCL